MSYGWQWKPYVSIAERRREAEREKATLRKKGRMLAPVVIEGRAIARTFWGTAWCKNLESYSDFANRLPRGRSYVRNGFVLHLEIAAGSVKALVRGASLYDVRIGIAPVPKARWQSICRESAGAIDSLVELLQGRFSKGVMERFCQQRGGLFPAPADITLSCSCPDWAEMCKHVAAVLYGVGARLDERPQLLFRLRKVDEKELIANADPGTRLVKRRPPKDKVLMNTNLAELFVLPMAADEGEPRRTHAAATSPGSRRRKAAGKTAPGRRPSPPRKKPARAVGKQRGAG